jgi:hypothetical protein
MAGMTFIVIAISDLSETHSLPLDDQWVRQLVQCLLQCSDGLSNEIKGTERKKD